MYGEDLLAIERMISDLLAEKRVGSPDWVQIYLYAVSCSSWLWALSPRFGSGCDVILLGVMRRQLDLTRLGCCWLHKTVGMQCSAMRCNVAAGEKTAFVKKQ
jgi:hypothetical protein